MSVVVSFMQVNGENPKIFQSARHRVRIHKRTKRGSGSINRKELSNEAKRVIHKQTKNKNKEESDK